MGGIGMGALADKPTGNGPQGGYAVGMAHAGDWRFGIPYDDLARLVIAVAFGLAWLTFRDYGITNDEEVQDIYGQMVLSFYASGFHDLSALSYKDLFYYGGLFDLAAALLNKISPLGHYETRHLLGGLVGTLGLVGSWKLARLLAGERAGFLAVALLTLTPAYYGPAFNNPKDIPFAVGMLWTVYAACRLMPELPKPSLRRVLWFGVSLGLTLGIRVGAGMAGIYLVLALLAFLGWRLAETGKVGVLWADGRRLTLALLPGLPVAYLTMAVFWPWAWQSPTNPLVAIRHFSHYGINIDTLLAGRWLNAQHLPADYLPLYLVVKLPEVVLAGLVAALALAAVWGWQVARRHTAADRPLVLQYLMLFLAVAFPLAFFVVVRPTIYNGIRHFEFLLPPTVVMAAIALDRLWGLLARGGRRWNRGVGVALGAAALVQVWVMAGLHPNEYVYYNALVGGVKGANGQYELDYWGNSLAEASRDLARYVELENNGHAPSRTYKVAVCGLPLGATYYMPRWLQFTDKPAESDFFVGFTQHGCDHMVGGRPIISVARFGAPLSVVKDRRPTMEIAPPRAVAVPARLVN